MKLRPCLVLSFLTFTLSAVAADYYVDAHHGSDLNTGRSGNDDGEKSGPWRTFAPINVHVFEPGDRILLKRGSRWEETLRPRGSGVAGQPVVIDAYGAGPLPQIALKGQVTPEAASTTGPYTQSACIHLEGQSHWTIRNLSLSNDDDDHPSNFSTGWRTGIFVRAPGDGEADATGQHYTGFLFENLEIRRIDGAHGKQPPQKNFNGGIIFLRQAGRFSGIVVQDCLLEDIDGVGINFEGAWFKNDFPAYERFQNVIVRRNTIRRTGGDGATVRSGSNAVFESNRVYDVGYHGDGQTKAVAALWTASCRNALYQYNEIARTRKFELDGQPFDTDGADTGLVVVQYNYTHDNEGGFFLWCTPTARHKDGTHASPRVFLRSNVSVNDGRKEKEPALVHNAGWRPADITAENNVFYHETGIPLWRGKYKNFNGNFSKNVFYFHDSQPSYPGLTLKNNVFYPAEAFAESGDSNLHFDPRLVNPGQYGDGYAFYRNFLPKNDSPLVRQGIGPREPPVNTMSTHADYAAFFENYPK